MVTKMSGECVSFNYLSTFDPWLKHNISDTEWIVKMNALTSKNLVISDNQALNNISFQYLLKRSDFQKFITTPNRNGYLPISISMRKGINNFYDILDELLMRREIPPIFPWASSVKQKKIEHEFNPKTRGSLDSFFKIAGKDFRQHVNFLNSLLKLQDNTLLRWEHLDKNYPELVNEEIDKLYKLDEIIVYNKDDINILKLKCDQISKIIANDNEVNRSNLFRFINTSSIPPKIKNLLILKILHEPYHKNFSISGGFNMVTGTEFNNNFLGPLVKDNKWNNDFLTTENILEIDEFPIDIGQLSYSRISTIRNTYSFQSLLTAIENTSSEDCAYALRDLLVLISSEAGKDVVGLSKLSKIHINIFRHPNQLRKYFGELGVTFSDIVSIVSKAGGFVTGELAGQLIGVFGIGGIVGTGAGLVVEQVIDKAILKPKRIHEFQQVIRLLNK